MRRAIDMELECDAIALLPGWPMSRGSRREFDIALDLRFELFMVIPGAPKEVARFTQKKYNLVRFA